MPAIASVILAAGHGTRMRSELPKVLHPVAHRPMVHHVMALATGLGAERQVVVVGSQAPRVADAARRFDPDVGIAVQDPPKGTADAVGCALPALEGFEGVVLILYADTPLVTSATVSALVGEIEAGGDLAVLGFEPAEPGAYGRLVVDAKGHLERIVEAKDAGPEELKIGLCNSGVMAVSSARLREYLPQIGNDNAKGEYYLTDLVELVTRAGGRAAVVTGGEDEVFGVNDRVELAEAEAIFQRRKRIEFMRSGVTMTDPSTVYFAADTEIGQDAVLGPGIVFGPGVRVAKGATLHAWSHLEGAEIAEGASVGPFARIRPGSVIGEGAKVGNFVETKKAVLGKGAKVSHLTYLGDASVGEEANIGAGTITCNYDGFEKFTTVIGAGAFVGSNSSLVAPVEIGEGAYIGSGSVITKNVEKDSLAVARGRQIEKSGWALSFRKRQKKSGD
ncbi:MAG: bifunctional UDP-N-acetylglucosamine diphosphorylase/glucosamine-1-phosphate N-acetyltransferase GlmU [Parvularcula sp.]